MISVMVQFLTGHNVMGRHYSLLEHGTEDHEDAICKGCGKDVESSYHIFAECPALGRIRREIFGSHVLKMPFKYTPKQLWNFLKEAKLPAFELYMT